MNKQLWALLRALLLWKPAHEQTAVGTIAGAPVVESFASGPASVAANGKSMPIIGPANPSWLAGAAAAASQMREASAQRREASAVEVAVRTVLRNRQRKRNAMAQEHGEVKNREKARKFGPTLAAQSETNGPDEVGMQLVAAKADLMPHMQAGSSSSSK